MTRITAIADTTMVHYLNTALGGSDYNLTCASEFGDIKGLLDREETDMVLLDGTKNDIDSVCGLIREHSMVPIAFVIPRDRPDWNSLYTSDADGYIQPVGGINGLVAQIKAMIRRSKYAVGN